MEEIGQGFHSPESPNGSGIIDVYQGDNLEILQSFTDRSFDLIYVDPPFNTGRTQSRTQIKTKRDNEGDRIGFQGNRYRTTVVGSMPTRLTPKAPMLGCDPWRR